MKYERGIRDINEEYDQINKILNEKNHKLVYN